MPVIYWPRRTYFYRLLAGFVVFLALLAWVTPLTAGSTLDYIIFWSLLLLGFLQTIGTRRYVILNGVFAAVRGSVVSRRAPLAATDLMRRGLLIRLRWPDEGRTRTLWAILPAPFGDALEEAALAARSADPGSVPATAAEVAETVTFGLPAPRKASRWNYLLLACIFTLAFVGARLGAPWSTLLPVLLFLAPDMNQTPHLLALLSGEVLWLLAPGEEPLPIPVSSVQGVRSKDELTVITTCDEYAPEIRLDESHSSALIGQLQHLLGEESPPPPEIAGPA